MAEAAGSVKIILAVDSTSYSAALDKAKAQLKQLEGSVGSAAAKTRAEMGEARGAIALLGEEIGVRLPRHVRSFVAELPGVAAAMSAAFSAVAVVGLGLAIFEAGKKVYEFVQKNKEAAEKNAEAWKDSREALRLQNLELDASTIHLQNELAKLEHKPENKLAEEMAHTAVEVVKLDQELKRATDDARKLLAEQEPGMLAQMFLHKGGTAYEQTLAKKHSDALAGATSLQDQLNESVAYHNSLLERRNELEAAQAGKSTYLTATGETKTLDKGKFAFATGLQTEIDATNELLSSQAPEQARIQAQMNEDTAAANLAKKQQSVDALNAQKQAAEKQMQEWRRELDALKAVTDLTAQQEADYWQALAASVKNNAPLLVAATEEANKAATAANKKYQEDLMSGWVAANRDFLQQQADDIRIHGAIEAAFDQGQKAIKDAAAEQTKAARENFENTTAEIEAAERIQEAAIQLQEQRGQLSHAAAALAIQQLHATSAAAWTQAFGTAQNAGAGFTLAFAEKHAAGVGRQAEADTAARESATALGALKDSATELEARFMDIPATVRETLNSTVNTINGALLRTLTDPYHRGQWKDAGKQIFTGLAGSGLKLAEGSLAKMVPGLAKLGATAATAMWTRSADLLGTAGSAASNLLGKSTGAVTGGVMGTVGSFLVKTLGHFQTGGEMTTGMPAIVGEAGPELFIPSTAGRVISNSAMTQFGGAVSNVVHIDARGAGDPAAVEAAVHRSMRPYLQQIPTMTMQTMHQYNARRPVGARG